MLNVVFSRSCHGFERAAGFFGLQNRNARLATQREELRDLPRQFGRFCGAAIGLRKVVGGASLPV